MIKTVIALCVLLISATAAADTGRTYMILDAARVNSPYAWDPAVTGGSYDSNNSTNAASAFRFSVGRQFNDYFALEIGSLSSNTLNASGTLNGTAVSATQSLTGINLSAAFQLPLGKQAAIVVRLGGLVSLVKSSVINNASGSVISSGTLENATATSGLGMVFNLSDKTSLSLMYDNLGKLKSNSQLEGAEVTTYSCGVIFKY